MCGIAGLFAAPDARPALAETGQNMLQTLTHRGPDSHGLWFDEHIGLVLGHKRLAIQDLSELGHQPMWSHSRRFCIVFNGEIYNFKNLAGELGRAGHIFTSHSDTEVLLCAIEEWGLEGAVQRATGMFAFALWDTRERVLNLCRDRLGEKPLYYGWADRCFFFASELQAIEAALPDQPLAIDPQALVKYLQYGYITAPDSIYHGIYKLVPGTILSCKVETLFNKSSFSPCPDSGRFSPRTYWSVQQAANLGLQNQITSPADAARELESLLHRTVSMQTIADVGVGVFLSGGIDSSTVTAIAQSESTNRVRTFSIGFTEKEFDESGYAEAIARHLGTDHSTITVSSSDALDVITGMPHMFDEPFADSSQIPTYLVSKFAREHVTVCLSGDGGDELFAGYNRYISTENIWNRIGRIPKPLRHLAGKLLAAPTPGFWDAIYRYGYPGSQDEMKRKKLVGLKMQKLAGLLQQDNLANGYDFLLSYWHSPNDILARAADINAKCLATELPATPEFIDHAMYLDQVGYLQGDNLTKVDRASMAVSLETRLPLLSHELVELSWRIPLSLKIRENTSKWILRQVLYKHIPHELVDRMKMGFSVPVAGWLRKELREWAEDLLGVIGNGDGGWLAAKPIRQAWNDHLAGKRDNSQRLWTVLMLLAWMKKAGRNPSG